MHQNNHTTKLLNQFVALTSEFLQGNQPIDYQKLCDDFIRLVEAKYCVFRLNNFQGLGLQTVAFSGEVIGIKRAAEFLGFNPISSRWEDDAILDQKTKGQILTRFATFKDMMEPILSEVQLKLIMNFFNLGETYILKINVNQLTMGSFIFVMDRDHVFTRESECLLFAQLLGVLLTKQQTEVRSSADNVQLSQVVEFLPDAFYAVDNVGRITIWNRAMEIMTGLKSEQMIGKGNYEYTIPFYGERRPNLLDLLDKSDEELAQKYNDVKRVESYVEGNAFWPAMRQGSGGWIYGKASYLYDDHQQVIGKVEVVRDITVYYEMMQELQENEAKYNKLFMQAPLGYQSLDGEGRFYDVNEAWLATLGYNHDEVIGRWFGDFIIEEMREDFKQRFEVFKIKGQVHSEFAMIHKSGDIKMIAFDGRVAYKNDGSFDKTHCILQDITEKRIFEEKLIESEQNYKALFEFSDVGIGYYTPDGYVISYNNKAAANMGGVPEDFVGKYILDLFPDEAGVEYLRRITSVAQSRETMSYEDCVPLPGGDVWFFSTHTAIITLDGKVRGVQIISQNITAIKLKEQEIRYLSYHDQLTGLYNRRFFEEELLRLDVGRNLPLTIAMGDVNGLKLINDSFGHQMGDELLIRISKVMKRVCRQDDIIARWGGDEFAIIFPETNEGDVEGIVKRIIEAAANELVGQFPVSVSFGYATKYNGEDINQILKQSEDLMYQHKLYESTSARNSMINLIMNALVEKNEREMEHSRRVSEMSVELAKACGFDYDRINQVKMVGLLHDIGKIGIEENILNSVEKLTEESMVLIRKHTEIGYRILCSATDFMEIANDVYEHHERWDGKGYPRGIKGNNISINARIVAIADSYDAMVSARPSNYYKKPMSKSSAIKELKVCAGKQFDPKLARIFVEHVLQVKWDEE
jgi:diguanylate cyclase